MKKRFVQIDNQLIEVDEDYIPEPKSEYHIMGDIKPYRSMIDGSEITSRSKHREHLRMHGCVEVGNDSSVLNPRPVRPDSPPRLKEHVIRATDQVLGRK